MRIFVGPAYLVLNNAEEVYSVDVFYKGKKLKKGTAYLIDGVAYIYRGKLKKTADSSMPGIYKTVDGYKIVEPTEREKETLYSDENIITFDPEEIITKIATSMTVFQQPEDIEIINNNSELYIPTIKDTDDFLKVLVKMIITNKKINIRKYKGHFANEYALNNMKSGLKRDTKMTVTNFKAWCEILGVQWKMVVSDDGTDTLNPLKEPIEIDSSQF